MFIPILILVAGFAILIKSADYLVDGASSIAKRFGISSIVIGLTVVAFGTSAPELLVNILAAAQGSTELAIGNVLGSNIANIFLILGVAATITTLKVKENTTWKEIPLALLAVVVLGILANDALIDNLGFSVLSRIDGLMLLSFFIIFLYYTFGIAKVSGEEVEVPTRKLNAAIAMSLGGLVGLAVGGQLVVESATTIATGLGVSEALIGLTVVALGTSLPELVTAVVAARKKQVDIVIGNVVGSNIFNVFWILGLSATIRPLDFSPAMNIDLLMTIGATLLLFIFMFTSKGEHKHKLTKKHGIGFLVIYAAYIVYLVVRG